MNIINNNMEIKFYIKKAPKNLVLGDSKSI